MSPFFGSHDGREAIILSQTVTVCARTTRADLTREDQSRGSRIPPCVLRLLHVIPGAGTHEVHHGGTEDTELKLDYRNHLRLSGIWQAMYAEVVLKRRNDPNCRVQIDAFSLTFSVLSVAPW